MAKKMAPLLQGLEITKEMLKQHKECQVMEMMLISLYPNPARNILFIVGSSSELESISLSSSLGQQVNNLIEISYESDTEIKMDVSKLPAGVYFIKSRTAVRKLTKE